MFTQVAYYHWLVPVYRNFHAGFSQRKPLNMMITQRQRRTREVTGPAPQSVAIVSLPLMYISLGLTQTYIWNISLNDTISLIVLFLCFAVKIRRPITNVGSNDRSIIIHSLLKYNWLICWLVKYLVIADIHWTDFWNIETMPQKPYYFLSHPGFKLIVDAFEFSSLVHRINVHRNI